MRDGAGRCGTAATLTDALIERVATAEAVNLAAYVLHRAGLHQRVLDALADPVAFPSATLPDNLRRIAITSKAALGRLVEAARELSDLAAVTGAPMDIWTSIGWQVVGAVSDARDLYLRHRDRLGEIGPGHLQLANAVIRTDPTLATDIARRLVADAPDELVTATFELANRLRLDDAQGRLVKRIQMLGVRGEAGVQVLTGVDEVLVRMEEHCRRVDEAWEVYQNRHGAVHILALFNPVAFAEQYLGNLLDPPQAPRRPSPLQARYARRYDEGVWPERREDVSLVVDLSALLTIPARRRRTGVPADPGRPRRHKRHHPSAAEAERRAARPSGCGPSPRRLREAGDLPELGSHPALSICPALEPMAGGDIAFMAPRVAGFVRDAIDHEDQAVARNGWMRLPAAEGHGALPPKLAAHIRHAAAKLDLLTQEGPLVQDLAVVLSIATLAAMNG